MTTGVADDLFLDTNILVFASEQRAPLHARARLAVEDEHSAGTVIWISRQILREYLATLSRPQTWGNPQSINTLIGEVRYFKQRFRTAEDGPLVTLNLLALAAEVSMGGKQVHDANIVATMQAYGIRRLLTHNVADFARFSRVIEVVPL